MMPLSLAHILVRRRRVLPTGPTQYVGLHVYVLIFLLCGDSINTLLLD